MLKKMVILILILPLILSGCYGKIEVNELAIISAMGVDKLDNEDILITVLANIPIAGNMSKPNPEPNVWRASAAGKNFSDAVQNLHKYSAKKILFEHSKFVIVGNEMARSGLEELFNFFMRSRELRLRARVLVADKKARDIFETPSDVQVNVSSEIIGMIDNQKGWSFSYIPDFKEVLVSTKETTNALVLGRIFTDSAENSSFATSKSMEMRMNKENDEVKTIQVEGGKVLKDFKLLGDLDMDEIRGYLLVTGKMREGVVTTKENKTKKDMSMKVRRIARKIDFNYDGNKLNLEIKLYVTSDLQQLHEADYKLTKESLMELETQFAKKIESDMKKSFVVSQKKLKADFFELSSEFHRKKPKEWRIISSKWDNLFEKMDVKYDVKVVVKRIGELNGALYSE